MIEVTNKNYASDKWAETITFNHDERRTLIRMCEFSRGLLIALVNVREGCGAQSYFDQVRFLADVDSILDRLKYAEKQ